MQKVELSLGPIILVGIKTRTNYQTELDKLGGKIFPCVQKYFHQQIFNKIFHRKKPGTTYCVYTDYTSDYLGEYTYFIGEEVSSTNNQPTDLETLVIPAQTYSKFTTGPDSMPHVIVNAWQKIWQMSPVQLGGKRNYTADFEIYDERARDHSQIILDIYIGITKINIQVGNYSNE